MKENAETQRVNWPKVTQCEHVPECEGQVWLAATEYGCPPCEWALALGEALFWLPWPLACVLMTSFGNIGYLMSPEETGLWTHSRGNTGWLVSSRVRCSEGHVGGMGHWPLVGHRLQARPAG